ncbi:30S ribosomal protein S4 [Candidatus Kaiserbacteria bacterium RIFCSPHIGHO2_02_FULL_49_11]|uniref:Small ribosomal subunit protein uS4 n=1 Tax=Candidatus Kaiserbacteria bacterium RIFCSPHIGHO2_02_FULL_49_11 TaxID=1798489 RepID=A0A1F6CYX7_9BACT|nr:MAG: 30S ribosomal protein S4 [Candidatus Kaiserbacteria bacterium RIFCSPHIGHO2_02_FULL_49_11]
MIIGPKYKIGKRLGASVFEKCQTQKFMLSEARSKQRRGKRPRQLSDYGRQLLEKQKVRFTYGITEKQLSRYVEEATHSVTGSADKIYQGLEQRLDNVVYRLGFALTRRAARQFVSHGHILVNGKRVTIPSYKTKVGEKISIRTQSMSKGLFANLDEQFANKTIPGWLSLDSGKKEGSIKEIPHLAPGEASFNLSVVLEYYSR